MGTIFPNSVSDIDMRIIDYCDTDTQIRLSGVNKRSDDVLSNVKFFHDRFFIQHPVLTPFNKLCTILPSHHPSNYWKVMCKALDPQYRKQFPQKFNSSFLEKAVPCIREELHAKKGRLEEKVKGICGTHYADPSSPIDQAWKKYKNCEQELAAARRGEDPATAFRSRRMLNLKMIDAKKAYEKLENDRSGCDKEIQKINQDLADVPNKHQNDLTNEFIETLSLENALKIKPHLDECYAILREIVLHPEEKPPPKVLERIQYLINACTYEDETSVWEPYCYWGSLIWRSLYFKSANRIIEDSWAEKHFHEFMVTLFIIIGDEKRTLSSRIKLGHTHLNYT